VNIFFCEEKQKVGLFVYHLEGLRAPLLVRVPQFGNHCSRSCDQGKITRKVWKIVMFLQTFLSQISRLSHFNLL